MRLSVRSWLALSSLSWFRGVPFCCFCGLFTWVCAVPLIVLALIIASLIWLEEEEDALAAVAFAERNAGKGSDGNTETRKTVESLVTFRANFMADEARKDPYGFPKIWYKQVVVGSFSKRALGMIYNFSGWLSAVSGKSASKLSVISSRSVWISC